MQKVRLKVPGKLDRRLDTGVQGIEDQHPEDF